MTAADGRLDVVIVTCAISAGIHAALVQDHFEEGVAAGVGFVAAAALLAILAIILTRAPATWALLATAAVFAGLISAYVLVLTTGVPVLHPDVESLDGLAVFTKLVEALGLVTAVSLVPIPALVPFTQPKGTVT